MERFALYGSWALLTGALAMTFSSAAIAPFGVLSDHLSVAWMSAGVVILVSTALLLKAANSLRAKMAAVVGLGVGVSAMVGVKAAGGLASTDVLVEQSAAAGLFVYFTVGLLPATWVYYKKLYARKEYVGPSMWAAVTVWAAAPFALGLGLAGAALPLGGAAALGLFPPLVLFGFNIAGGWSKEQQVKGGVISGVVVALVIVLAVLLLPDAVASRSA